MYNIYIYVYISVLMGISLIRFLHNGLHSIYLQFTPISIGPIIAPKWRIGNRGFFHGGDECHNEDFAED